MLDIKKTDCVTTIGKWDFMIVLSDQLMIKVPIEPGNPKSGLGVSWEEKDWAAVPMRAVYHIETGEVKLMSEYHIEKFPNSNMPMAWGVWDHWQSIIARANTMRDLMEKTEKSDSKLLPNVG